MIRKALLVFWASPNTILGLVVGGCGLLTGGRIRARGGCIEFYGGFVRSILRRAPLSSGAIALTLGHSILGQSAEGLDYARAHEHVHVRQYERWGPFFLPAYLGSSFWLWLNGHDPYRDNPFERAAYDEVPSCSPQRIE